MKKSEFIEKHGVEAYEEYKAKHRLLSKEYYHKHKDERRISEVERIRKWRKANKDYRVNRENSDPKLKEVHRIEMRDCNRLAKMGLKLRNDGKEVHHFKYHSDNSDASWIDDIAVMTLENHRAWHMEHPDFVAIENIV